MEAGLASHNGRVLANPYGAFDQETFEFVVTDVLTPRPWVNVLANESYGLVLSQAGGGFSWADNCQLFRLTRWEQDLVSDAYGRFVYVLDLESPDEVWSTTYQPTRRRADSERVRHGLGYTVFERSFRGLETSHTVFVPEDEPCELWLVRIDNATDRTRRIRLGSYLEWQLGSIGDWHREFHRLFCECRAEASTLYAWKHPGLKENRRDALESPIQAFIHVAGVEEVAWYSDKGQWLGRCGSTAEPAMVLNPAPPTRPSRWDDPVAGMVVELEIAPRGSCEIGFVVGASANPDQCRGLVERYDVQTIRAESNAIRRRWAERCSRASIETADDAANLLCNGWLPYQAIAGRLVARCAYYQQGGAYGYRDQLQDSLLLLASEPQRTLHQLGLHAEAMYEDGGVRHWWHPNTPIFVESRHSDTCLWLAYGTLAYLDETADLDALRREYAFLSRQTQSPASSGTLFDHCVRGIRRALDLRSARGLPLIGAGDWNDGLSHAGIEGKGESVWLAMFLYHILDRWEPYLMRLGETQLAAELAREAESLRTAVNEHGWDGEWYIAGTRDDGKPFGAKGCDQGEIFLNPQTWAVISGIAPPERVRSAMNAVRERLVKPYGALLLAPAFHAVDPYIGYITRYAPGVRENGGVYSHASTWAIQAFCQIGDAATAQAIFQGMCPPLRAQADADLYAAEPYVLPGNVDGPDSPYEGRAGWTWYTGSAAWLWRAAMEHVCGVRATFDGLEVKPNVPESWGTVRVRRPFRGDVFEMELRAGAEPVVRKSTVS